MLQSSQLSVPCPPSSALIAEGWDRTLAAPRSHPSHQLLAQDIHDAVRQRWGWLPPPAGLCRQTDSPVGARCSLLWLSHCFRAEEQATRCLVLPAPRRQAGAILCPT